MIKSNKSLHTHWADLQKLTFYHQVFVFLWKPWFLFIIDPKKGMLYHKFYTITKNLYMGLTKVPLVQKYLSITRVTYPE